MDIRRLPWLMRYAGFQGGLAIAYVGLGFLSFSLAQVNDVVTENLFVPEGYALAVALLFGLRIWPSVLIGQLVLGVARQLPAVEALATALANVAELFVGVSLLNRLHFSAALSSARDYVILAATETAVLQPLSRGLGMMIRAVSRFYWPAPNAVLGVLTFWSIEQAICQILATGTVLAVVDAVRRRESSRYWAGLGASMVVTGALFYMFASQLVRQQLEFVHIVSLVYLIMFAVTVMYDLVGAMIGNVLLLGLTQYVMYAQAVPLLQLADAGVQARYVNVFLIGVLLNAGLLGALLKERNDRAARLKDMAHHDYLTGLCNRRYFYEMAERELAKLKRHELNVGVICIDIDWFKQINDARGHHAGDRALVFFSEVLQKQLRSGDIAARMGGEEFTILVDGVRDVHTVAERLRRRLSDALEAQPDIPAFTVSMGTTSLRSDDPDIHAALRRADAALYQAKRIGRNRVVADDVQVVLS